MGLKRKENDTDRLLAMEIHCAAFKEFLSQNDDIVSDRLFDSSRAKKARGKLERLTLSQFYELSVDSYDELERRLDLKHESLLPNYSFHPKRNNARKKLSGLPPPRFRDLVSDCLYEIERRMSELTKEKNITEMSFSSPAPAGIQATTIVPTKSSLSLHSDSDVEVEKDTFLENSVTAENPEELKLVSTVSSLGYRKATETSDETEFESNGYVEINGNPLEIGQKDINTLTEEANTMDKTITLHEQTIENLKAKMCMLEKEKRRINSDHEESLAKRYLLEREVTGNKEMINQLEKELNTKRNEFKGKVEELEHTIEGLKLRSKELEEEKEAASEKFSNLREAYDKLQKRYELAAKEQAKLKEQTEFLTLADKEFKQAITEERASSSKKIKSLQDQTEALQDKLESANATIESLKNNVQMSLNNSYRHEAKDRKDTIEGLNAELDNWKHKYQTLKDELDGNRNGIWGYTKEKVEQKLQSTLKNSMDSTGLISFEHIKSFEKYVFSFFQLLEDDTSNDKLLLKYAESIIDQGNLIAKTCASLQQEVQYDSIKSSLSHVRSCTKNFLVNKQTLPKFVVQSSISEVVFNVCDFAAIAKIISPLEKVDNTSSSFERKDCAESLDEENPQKFLEEKIAAYPDNNNQVRDTKSSVKDKTNSTKAEKVISKASIIKDCDTSKTEASSSTDSSSTLHGNEIRGNISTVEIQKFDCLKDAIDNEEEENVKEANTSSKNEQEAEEAVKFVEVGPVFTNEVSEEMINVSDTASEDSSVEIKKPQISISIERTPKTECNKQEDGVVSTNDIQSETKVVKGIKEGQTEWNGATKEESQVLTNSRKLEYKPKPLANGTSQASSVSGLKFRFDSAAKGIFADGPIRSRNFSPSGSILTRMKQLESSFNSARPSSSSSHGQQGIVKPLPEKMVQKFGSKRGTLNRSESISSFERQAFEDQNDSLVNSDSLTKDPQGTEGN